MTATITDETVQRLPLLVGEQNPYGADPIMALYPLPRQAAGNRLRTILGLSDNEYLSAFRRCNLLGPGPWSVTAAREAAAALLAEGGTAPLVLLGARVAAAFGLDFRPYVVARAASCDGRQVLVLPHPSGRSRLWNEPGAARRACEAVAELRRGRGLL